MKKSFLVIPALLLSSVVVAHDELTPETIDKFTTDAFTEKFCVHENKIYSDGGKVDIDKTTGGHYLVCTDMNPSTKVEMGWKDTLE